jgi:putative endonuclease
MAWMYILQCSDESYYAGSTRNLDLRFSQHQQGKGSKYTSTRLPVQLVYYEEYDRVSDAYAREKQVQGWSRRKREALINGTPELLPALAKKVFSKNKITENTVVEWAVQFRRIETTPIEEYFCCLLVSIRPAKTVRGYSTNEI